jgi:hypothetical protein
MTARLCILIALMAMSARFTSAQRSEAQIGAGGVTISEPGIYDLLGLFKHADSVAIVKIVSGDTENYDVAVYKAKVVKSFKGTSAGETLYFGPYVGEKLGAEYIVFLRNEHDLIAPKAAADSSYGRVRYAKVFDEGYSSMETSYGCVFDGQQVSQQCDYGVRVCTDYIKLPKNTRTFPTASDDTPFGCRWVRKASFVSLLEALRETPR